MSHLICCPGYVLTKCHIQHLTGCALHIFKHHTPPSHQMSFAVLQDGGRFCSQNSIQSPNNYEPKNGLQLQHDLIMALYLQAYKTPIQPPAKNQLKLQHQLWLHFEPQSSSSWVQSLKLSQTQTVLQTLLQILAVGQRRRCTRRRVLRLAITQGSAYKLEV